MSLIALVFSTLLLISSLAIAVALNSTKQQHRVRIAGIDAPEKGQAYGNASRKRMSELVARKNVRVEFRKRDRYGRTIGKEWVQPPCCPTRGKTIDVELAQITTGMVVVVSEIRQRAIDQSPSNRSKLCLCFSNRFEEEAGMSKKLYRPEEIIGKLREKEGGATGRMS